MTVRELTHRLNLINGIATQPHFWESAHAYEFWAFFGHDDVTNGEAATNFGLDGRGWTQSGAGSSGGSTADFLSSSDRDARYLALTTLGNHLTSPRVFGSYDHMLQASEFLGYMPTKLNAEFAARFNVSGNNETLAFIGFAAPGTTDCAGAGGGACIRSGGTGSTFFLTSDNGSDAGANIDGSFHTWKISIDATNTEWFIDGVSQGTIATEADIWPLSFMNIRNNNNIHLIWVRIWYS